MTVLQMSGADAEGTSPPPPKKRRYSQIRTVQYQRHSDETWIESAQSVSDENSHHMPAATSTLSGEGEVRWMKELFIYFENLGLIVNCLGTMVNSYGVNDPFSHTLDRTSPEENGYSDSVTPIVPLVNLGNTCFLNSVLYTLRFAPSFLHKLHHLSLAKPMCTVKVRSHSLFMNWVNVVY